MVQTSTQYNTKAEKEEALWRTLIFNRTTPNGKGVPDASYAVSYRAYRDFINFELNVAAMSESSELLSHTQSAAVQEEWQSKRKIFDSDSAIYQTSMGNFIQERQSCSTESGHFGWAPLHARIGDKICIFLGYPIPFVLRPVEGEQSGDFELIGEAYLHGLMDGEAIKLSDAPLEMIKLA